LCHELDPHRHAPKPRYQRRKKPAMAGEIGTPIVTATKRASEHTRVWDVEVPESVKAFC
jgi:hypothetical protein